MSVLRKSLWATAFLVILVAIVVGVLLLREGFVGAGLTATTGHTRVPSEMVGRSASGDEADFVELTEEQATSIQIQIRPVETRKFEILKTPIGIIDFNGDMTVDVFSQYPGKILKAFYKVGNEVKKGDLLFTIDSQDLLQAKSTLLAAAGVLELQNRVLARVTGLLKAGGSAQKDVDQATSDQQTAEGNFKAAMNAVRVFGKSEAEIQQVLSDRKVESTLAISCPIDGRVVTRNAAPGLFTQPGTPPAPFSVADTSTMWMIANVVEKDAPAYKVGQPVDASVEAYPDKVFKGHVTTVGSVIDPNTRRQLVRSEIEDPEHLLRSGMYASFVIRVGEPMLSLAVPENGVVREGDGTMTVWVKTDGRRFVKRTVSVGLRQNGWVQILEGLRPDEIVVTQNALFLSNKLLLGDSE